MKRASRLIALTVAGLVFGAATASADVRWYLYNLGTRSGEPQFAGEIPVGNVIKAGYAVVTTDSLGRIAKVTWFWGSTRTVETVYQFSAGGKLPISFDSYAATGELSSRNRIHRNNAGDRIRIDQLTATGEMTGFSIRTLSAESVEMLSFTAQGTRTGRSVSYYSPAGILIRARSIPDDTTYYESEYDVRTGLAQSRKKMKNGQLESSNKYAYDSYGDLTRDDIYDENGVWYGVREYVEDLQTVERYKFTDGTSEESRFTYDDSRRTKAVAFSINGQLICTFTYDRLSTGGIRRTLAVAPDGSLLAEYPDLMVAKVDRTGHPIDHPDAGTIYRRGTWWGPAQTAWSTYRSAEGRYTLLLPATPTLSRQEGTASTGEKIPQYLATATDPETQWAYLAGYFDVSPTQTYTVAKGRDGMLKAVNGTLISERAISLGGYGGLDVTIAMQSGGIDYIGRVRFYQVDRRIYLIEAIIPKSAFSQSDAVVAKFLDSFQVLRNP